MLYVSEDFDIAAIAASGQCFRLVRGIAGDWVLTAQGRVLHIAQAGSRAEFFCTDEAFRTVWAPYFDLGTDYGVFRRAVPPSDAFLSAAAQYGRGVRILRQDPWEMLITFILSQRKSIPAIRSCVEALCRRYGAPIPDAEGVRYAFPTPQSLAACGSEGLSACALGYRCGYVQAAARMAAAGEPDLAALAGLDDAALREQLLRVPGVGPKVANCVMLFGYHRLTGFPRDVWINRILDEVYGGDFPLDAYRGFEGVIQQYLFYYARSGALEKRAGK